jgi:hypothetical protein
MPFDFINWLKDKKWTCIDYKWLARLMKHLKKAQSSNIKQIRFIRLIRRHDIYCACRVPIWLEKNGGKCQSGTLNHQNGQNDVLITFCTGDWLAKFGFVPACIDNCNLSYHGSAQQLCTQGWNDILARGSCRPC